MNSEEEDQWSPARNPHAIAVSQSWWAMAEVSQFAADAKAAQGPAHQIYARQIFGHLRLLQRCAAMVATELVRLGVAQVHRDRLREEIDAFERAVPGATNARNLLEHFDEYARGDGRLQRSAMKELGSTCSRPPRCSGAVATTRSPKRSAKGRSWSLSRGLLRHPGVCTRRPTARRVLLTRTGP